MNIEDFREYCLSFEGVHEKMRVSPKTLWICYVNTRK